MFKDLLQSAVQNNAEWCELVANSHEVSNQWLDKAWYATGSMPPFYPNVVSLDVNMQHENISRLAEDLPKNCGWKDSFANLDLTEFGFDVKFEAVWYALSIVDFRTAGTKSVGTVTSTEELEKWIAAWGETPAEQSIFSPELMGPNVKFIFHKNAGGIDSGMIFNVSSDAIGISNTFERTEGIARCISYAFESAVDLPLVGYGSDDDLRMLTNLGFKGLGNLRVWVR